MERALASFIAVGSYGDVIMTISNDCTVVCYTRPTNGAPSIDAFIEALQRCEASGLIDALLFRTWPPELSLVDSDAASESRAAFERFRAWAVRDGVSICPPFEAVTQRSTITGEQRRVLHTPLLCLAFYVGAELAVVYPHTDGDGRTETVPDVIEILRTGSLPERVARAARDSPRLGNCPECGDACLSGQGMYACRSCRWVAGTTPRGQYRRLPTVRARWGADADSTSNATLHSQPRTR